KAVPIASARAMTRVALGFFLSRTGEVAQLYLYEVFRDGEFGRNGSTAPAGGARVAPAVGCPARTPPCAAAAHDRSAPRPAPARPGRCLGRDPGGFSGSVGPSARVPAAAPHAVLPVAPLPDRSKAAGAAPASSGGADARRGPGGLALPRSAAGNLLGRPRRSAPGTRHPAERGRHPCRAQDPPSGGAEQYGSARPRGAGPAPLRAAEQRRDRPGTRPAGVGGQQALRPGPEAAQGDPDQPARRQGGGVIMATQASGRDPVEVL